LYQKVSQVISIILCNRIDNDKEWKLLCIPYIEFSDIDEKLQYGSTNNRFVTLILILGFGLITFIDHLICINHISIICGFINTDSSSSNREIFRSFSLLIVILFI
jgi:hypothetical protein